MPEGAGPESTHARPPKQHWVDSERVVASARPLASIGMIRERLMAANLESAAAVVRPPDTSLGDLLADMRTWLDDRHIETVGFDIAKGQCEVRFKRPGDAHHFAQRFA